MLDVLIPAAVGATVSVIGVVNQTKAKILRMWLMGFFLAYFLADDLIKFTQELYAIELSKGSIVFLVSLLGAVVVEKIILIINSIKHSEWYK